MQVVKVIKPHQPENLVQPIPTTLSTNSLKKPLIRGFKVEHDKYLSGHVSDLPLQQLKSYTIPKPTENSDIIDELDESNMIEFENTNGTLDYGDGLYQAQQVNYNRNIGLKNLNKQTGYSKNNFKNSHFKKFNAGNESTNTHQLVLKHDDNPFKTRASQMQAKKDEQLTRRKDVYKKYTNVDPKYQNYEKLTQNLRREKRRKTLSPERKKCCTSQKLVKEQVRAKLIKQDRKNLKGYSKGQNTEFEQLDDFVQMEKQTDFNSKTTIPLGSKLANVIDLLEICLLQNKQEDEQVLLPQEKIIKLPLPKTVEKPITVRKPREKKKVEEKVSSLHKNTSGKIELEDKQIPVKIKERSSKQVKIVTRTYEVASLGYEYADLVSHMPSRIVNMNIPIEKLEEVYSSEKQAEAHQQKLKHYEDYVVIDEQKEVYQRVITEYTGAVRQNTIKD